MEGWVGEDFVGFGRQIELQKILFDNTNIVDVVFFEVCSKFGGGSRVGFNRPDFTDTFR